MMAEKLYQHKGHLRYISIGKEKSADEENRIKAANYNKLKQIVFN